MNWKKGIVMRFHSNTVSIMDVETKKREECVLRGKFKKQKIRPIVGDYIEYTLNEQEEYGKIENILPRKNNLYRPKIANVDQAVLVTTLKNPFVDALIVDKFLIQVEKMGIDCVIVVNKVDLLQTKEEKELLQLFVDTYSPMYTTIPVSSVTGENIDKLKIIFKDKISTMAGMSGVGKSSLLNSINTGLRLRVGEISDKLKRGKHTTTYTELLHFDFGGFIADTPGFSNLELRGFNKDEIRDYFIEFLEFSPYCGFSDCSHTVEPYCMIKEKYETGEIAPSRYENYVFIYEELKKRGDKRW